MPVKNIIKGVTLKFHKKSRKYLNPSYIKLIHPNHPSNCLTLDLVKIPNLSLKDLIQIQFNFKHASKYQLEVQLEDRLYSLSRSFKYNKFGNSGPKMELKNLSRSIYRYYSVQLSQKVFTEEDPGKKCKHYVETSYNDCDQQFIKKMLRENYPPGFMPVWATSNLSSVTTFITGDKSNFSEKYKNIILGTLESDCLPPCTSTNIISVFLDEKKENFTRSRIDITFSNKVSVVLTDFPKFNIAMFLSSCGGSMGMWLGVGVVQTVEMVVSTVWRLKMKKDQENLF